MRERKRVQEETSVEIEQKNTRKKTGKEEDKMKIREDIRNQHYRELKQYAKTISHKSNWEKRTTTKHNDGETIKLENGTVGTNNGQNTNYRMIIILIKKINK